MFLFNMEIGLHFVEQIMGYFVCIGYFVCMTSSPELLILTTGQEI